MAGFDDDDSDSIISSAAYSIHINNRLHITAGVLIKLIMKHIHFVQHYHLKLFNIYFTHILFNIIMFLTSY